MVAGVLACWKCVWGGGGKAHIVGEETEEGGGWGGRWEVCAVKAKAVKCKKEQGGERRKCKATEQNLNQSQFYRIMS